MIVLTPQNDEDAGEKRDNPWNDAEIESENSDEAYQNQIDREQQHSDVFVEGHGLMIWDWRPLSR
jgi:hypothetical protein